MVVVVVVVVVVIVQSLILNKCCSMLLVCVYCYIVPSSYVVFVYISSLVDGRLAAERGHVLDDAALAVVRVFMLCYMTLCHIMVFYVIYNTIPYHSVAYHTIPRRSAL